MTMTGRRYYVVVGDLTVSSPVGCHQHQPGEDIQLAGVGDVGSIRAPVAEAGENRIRRELPNVGSNARSQESGKSLILLRGSQAGA